MKRLMDYVNAAALICLAAFVMAGCEKDKKPGIPDKKPAVPPEIVEKAVDISAGGTANCYLIKPGSTVTFTTAYKGNSKTETTGNGASGKLVWQDTKGLVKSLNFDPAEQKIYIELSDVQGNAVVAVCDIDGNILWSWHLWVCNYDPELDLYTTEPNESGTTWTFMYRNLGAIDVNHASVDCYGMIYQWGRKDPFTAPRCYTVINEDYSYQEDGERELYDIDGNVLKKTRELAEYHGTIEKSIRQPMTFFAMTYRETGDFEEDGTPITECDYETKDWVDVSDDDYWGGVSFKKTIYDPCPVGYKVPVSDADGNTPYDWMKFADMTWDPANPGANIYGQWFPTAGTRVYASGGLDHQEANPYSGIWFGTVGKASTTNPALYGQYMAIMKGKRMFKPMKDARSQGMSVRCVKE